MKKILNLKPKYKQQKLINIFVIYTILAFIIGMALKVVLVAHIQIGMGNINDQIDAMKKLDPTSTLPNGVTVSKTLDTLNEAWNTELYGGILTQYPLIFAQLYVYVKSFVNFYRMYYKGEKLTSGENKKFKNEYWVFFVLFFVFDLFAIGMMIKWNAFAHMNGWLIYTLLTTTIIPILILGNIILVYKMDKITVKQEIYLVRPFYVKPFAKVQKIKYEEVKLPKALRWITWRIDK